MDLFCFIRTLSPSLFIYDFDLSLFRMGLLEEFVHMVMFSYLSYLFGKRNSASDLLVVMCGVNLYRRRCVFSSFFWSLPSMREVCTSLHISLIKFSAKPSLFGLNRVAC